MAPKKIQRWVKMFEMLPMDGLFYKCFSDVNKPDSRCILPGWEAAEIMMALNNKHEKPTKKDFDQDIALLFQKGTEYVRCRISTEGIAQFPGEIPTDSLFWCIPKKETIFNGIHHATVYRFGLKIMEAREAWNEAHDHDQPLLEQSLTAQAVDRFNNIITASSIFYPDLAGNLATQMIANMAVQVEREDTVESVRFEKGGADSVFAMYNFQPVTDTDDDNLEQEDQEENMEDTSTDESYDAILKQLTMGDMLNVDKDDMMDME
ncbi:hypothetical protein VP1G_06877 [Cytospora mali]|uniref:Uncharacterized protein n=1 Tax=Cytospora mali TaxID=578113 RepID=A0A194V6Y1_CYTMA|nr:hypothetical protein VP1G_06877 [Valsa mali var. pyri (nom. inval.)]